MDVIQQAAAVAAVLGLLGFTLWWLRRRGFAGTLPARRANAKLLECADRMHLGPQHALHLIRLGDRGLLLASFPSGCSLVESFPWKECDRRPEAGR